MTKRKMPDTCAKCAHAQKFAHWEWMCPLATPAPMPLERIPCRPGRLPLPLKDCPIRRKA
jgi:hypothetical protein